MPAVACLRTRVREGFVRVFVREAPRAHYQLPTNYREIRVCRYARYRRYAIGVSHLQLSYANQSARAKRVKQTRRVGLSPPSSR